MCGARRIGTTGPDINIIEVMKMDTYKEIRTFEFPNAIVRVYIPDLTEEERARRMKRIYKAAENLLKSAQKRKDSNEAGDTSRGV